MKGFQVPMQIRRGTCKLEGMDSASLMPMNIEPFNAL
jgi:hypothetical protein